MRARTGCIRERNGKIYAVVTFTDPVTGKRHFRERKAKNRTEARLLIKELLRAIDLQGARAFQAEKVTFQELATWYRETYLIEPQYRDGNKVAGLRSFEDMRRRLKTLEDFFGKRRIKDITFGDIERYRAERLATPKQRGGGQRTVTGIHRELEILRRMFSVAVREGWLARNPFTSGSKTLISQASENKRTRILTRDEELRLFAACDTPQRRHLRCFLMFLLDTGARKSEALHLRWRNVDFQARVMTLEKHTTKTEQERSLPIPSRLQTELEKLWLQSSQNLDEFVFPVRDPRMSFEKARNEAGLPWLRLHDLRHAFATRLVTGDLPLPMVANLLGHAQISMSMRYTNLNREAIQRAGAILDSLHEIDDQKLLVN
ncbi:MAG: tyrosine-type recombinase/integrase [Acidobacteria bacterium]|nr:tyrosine-type recombinase/integrase [Acidobacteriota bacterium]